jgi:hypothetical protein
VEGIGASFLDASLFDLSIFLEVSEEEELRRRCKRYSQSISQIKANSFDSRRAQYESNILPKRSTYDFVFATDEQYALHLA